jgi:ribonuclease HII
MLNFRIEKRLCLKTDKIIVGMDEAGRGPIAGPVAVGAVLVDISFLKNIRKHDTWWRRINDSKKLAPVEREKLFKFIGNNLPFGVGMVSASYIDRWGIKKATERAAKLALLALKIKPEIILQDGNRKFLKQKQCSQRLVVKGDGLLWSIACASIVAKVTRDNYMKKTGRRFPKYHFDKHKGYGTKLHISCLAQFGPCPIHRLSFAPLKSHEFQKSFSQGWRGTVRRRATHKNPQC